MSGRRCIFLLLGLFCVLASGALGQTLAFLDENGTVTSIFPEAGRVVVRVVHAAANTSSAVPDTVQVELTSAQGGDTELLDLRETGPNTGAFRGEIFLSPDSNARPGVLRTLSDASSRDTLQASYNGGAVTATASLSGSVLRFLDLHGSVRTSFAPGETIRVRAVNPLGRSPQFEETIQVMLASTGDSESIFLNETGAATGIFEGTVTISSFSGPQGDGVLTASAGETIEVSSNDSDLPTTSQTQATLTAIRVELTDGEGRPAEFLLESTRAGVRVVDEAASGSVTVTLQSDVAGDFETVTLAESSPGSKVFEGSIGMRFSPGSPDNGWLETRAGGPPYRFDTVQVSYTNGPLSADDTVDTLGSLTSFLDAAGNEVSAYAAGETVRVRVEDHNFDDPSRLDSVLATVRSLSTGDLEGLSLLEVGRNAGVFEGALPAQRDAPAASSDGRLQVQAGERIEAMHVDANNLLASGAVADLTFAAVSFLDEAGEPTAELLDGGIARVRVFSPADNVSPGTVDTLGVTLRTLYAGDREDLTLTETGADTGVFEGALGLRFNPAIQANGTLETLLSGPPDYLAEEITASYGPYLATAHLVGSRVVFLDAFGRETATTPLGEPVRLRVTDFARNDPQVAQSFTVSLLGCGDFEHVTLTETGFNNGVFEGSFASTSAASGNNPNGMFNGAPGCEIQAEHPNLNNPAPTRASATFTRGELFFMDAQGNLASVYLEGTRAYLRVALHGANFSPSSQNTVSVDMTTDLAGDLETVNLLETGVDTGIFEGSIGLRSLMPASAGNGVLETGEDQGPPHQFDTLRARLQVGPDETLTAMATTLNSRIWFVDAFGSVVASYAQGATVYVRVEDHDQNADPTRFDTNFLRLTSSIGDVEFLALLETGKDTGVFEGSIGLDNGSPSSDGRLQAGPGREILAERDSGFTAEPALATVEFAGIHFFDETGEPTLVVLEDGVARVRVLSTSDNVSPSQPDQVGVTLRSRYAGDREDVVLAETGSDTGVFEGSVNLNFAPSSQANGTLETLSSGPPEYRGEELTATYGPYTAMARTAGSRVVFVDGFGRETATVPLGEPVRLRVTDFTRNDPQVRDSFSVSLLGCGDFEHVTVSETGFSTSVFEGSIASTADPFTSSPNGVFNGAPGCQIQAELQNTNSPNPTVAFVTFSRGELFFVDAEGNLASVYLEGTRAYLRVALHGANFSPTSQNSVSVDVTTEVAGDVETVNLLETGVDTGVFEGSIGLRSLMPASQGNGTLETGEEQGPPHQFDILRARLQVGPDETLTAVAATVNSRIWFIDAFGSVVTSYAQGATAYVRMEDHDQNADPTRFDTAFVRLTSSSGDVEFLALLETGKDTGVFEGSIALQSEGIPASDGRLQAGPGSELLAERDSGFTAEPARATVEFAGIHFFDETGEPTLVVLEDGVARVRVLSAFDNVSFQPDQVGVTLRSRYAGDREDIVLTETGLSTGVFEGSVNLNFAPSSQANGTLETLSSGPPAYLGEEITATYGPYTATAHTAGSRVVFVDGFGRVVTTVPLGEPVRLRVTDFTRNNPQVRDSFNAFLFGCGDSESVTVTETGFSTGVFEGSIASTSASFTFSPNGVFNGAPGCQLQAEHHNINTPTATLAFATFTRGELLFVDAQGNLATVYLEGARAYLRVALHSANFDYSVQNSVSADVTTEVAGDSETVNLLETGLDTGVFEGSIGLRSLMPASQHNGELETGEEQGPPHQFDVLRARIQVGPDETLTAVATTLNSRIWFVDSYGFVVDSYTHGSTVHVRLEDHDQNADPTRFDTAFVRVTSSTGDVEFLALLEVGKDAGVFEGSIILDGHLSVNTGDGRLQAGPGREIMAERDSGFTAEPARAAIEFAGIQFIDAAGVPTVEVLENGTARVRVISTIDNSSPGIPNQVGVTLRSRYAGDREDVVLTETGDDTYVFEGSVPLSFAPSSQANGTLETLSSGSPEYLGEEITASYGPFTATARTVGSRVVFLDLFGRETVDLPLGEPVRLRLIDNTRNQPLSLDSFQITLQGCGDFEFVTVNETGFNTGVFEGSIASTSASSGNNPNGVFNGSPGCQIQAEHQNTNSPNPTVAFATFTRGELFFVDAQGNLASVYLEGTRAYLRVALHGANFDPSSQNSVNVDVTTEVAGDLESVNLLETGVDTGVFAGSIRLRSLMPASQHNGELETGEDQGPPHQFDTLRARLQVGPGETLTAVATALNSRIWFIDAFGFVVSGYLQGSTVFVRLEDHDQNVNPTQPDTAFVRLTSSTGDVEFLSLIETGADTGIFEASIPLDGGTPGSDGRLQAVAGSEITAERDSGFTAEPARATVDSAGVSFLDDTGVPTHEVLENSEVRVRVVSPDNNGNPGHIEDVVVTLRSRYAGDLEVMFLAETGPDTGVFERIIDLGFESTVPDNFRLEARNSGAPEYLDDELTASFGPYTAMARTVPSRVAFLNLRGQKVTTYSLRSTVRVRIEDRSRGQIGVVDSFAIVVRSLGSGDGDFLQVTETGPDTGVFEGSLPTSDLPTDFHDGVLTVVAGEQVEAEHANMNTPNLTVARVTFLANVAPQAVDDFAEAVQRQPLIIPVLANDLDPDPGTLAVAAVTQGANGTVAINPDGTVTYTSIDDFAGVDSFTYLVVDDQGGEDFGAVTVAVFAENQPPVANYDNPTTPEDQAVTVNVLANDTDPENDPLQVVSITQPSAGGTAVLNPDNTVTYTPVPNFHGDGIVFTYTIRDPGGLEATSAVTIVVTPVNDPPVANDDTATTTEDQAVTINLVANDSDIDSATWFPTEVTQPANGAVVLNSGEATYTPAANFSGTDTFTYTLRDDAGATDTATVTVTVSPVNDPPVANDDATSVDEDGSVSITVLANDTDPENDTLTVSSVTQGAHGSVTINANGTVKYTPAANYNGLDSFTYTISDGNGGTDTASVSVTVTAVNDAPTANADTASVAEDGTVNVSVLANDADPENDTLTVSSVTQGAHGSVTINANGTVQYTPAANYNGPDSFTYTISDGNGGTATAGVSVTVTAVNDAPVAVNDAASVVAGQAATITVLANDADIDGPSLTVTSVTQGTRGTVAINANQTVTYTASLFVGTDTFTYTVSDGAGGTATATVNVTLQAPPRVTSGIQVRYNFNEGSGSTVTDTSGVGTPLNLAISNTSTVTWLSGALSVNGTTIIASAGAATKVNNAVKASNAITVEAWVKPANLTQTGPARILAINKNGSQRNIAFGQTTNRYETQLRTSSGQPALQSPAGNVTLNLTHVVYTRSSSGQAVLYVNGVQVATQTTSGNLSTWDATQRLAVANDVGGGRLWQGELHLVAVYGRALTSAEVTQNNLAGVNAN